MKRFVITNLMLAVCACQALVYTLKPGGTARSLEEALAAKEVMKETLEINGQKGTLTVSSLDDDWLSLMARLNPLVEGVNRLPAGTTLVLEGERTADWLTRYLIIQTHPDTHIAIFCLRLPTAALKDGALPWPDALPEPAGSTVGTVMILGKSTAYATFTSSAYPVAVARDYDGRLLKAGWKRLEDAPDGGAAYLDKSEKRMVIFSVVQRQNRTFAAVYLTAAGKLH